MSNTIKYSEGSESLALNKGNWWIGTGDSNKGPTVESGYWNAINPPSGGYTVYLNKESNGPSIHSISNDEQLISFTNKISGNNYVNVAECLVYYQTQDDKLCVNREIENIVTDGLVLNLDAGYVPSYPTSGTTWYDLSGNGNDGTLINGPIYSGGSIVFDGVNDYVDCGNPSNASNAQVTVTFWYNPLTLMNRTYGSIINGRTPGGRFCLFWINDTTLSTQYRDDSGLSLANGGVWIRSQTSTGVISVTNQWYFIQITGNETTGEWRVGVNLNVSTTDFSSQYVDPDANRWLLGRGAYSLYDHSKIANFKVYNKILSQSEILQNYNAQKGRFGL